MAKVLVKDSSILVVATDWGLYREPEMQAVEEFRATANEHRKLLDAPGHLFSRSDEFSLSRLLAILLGTGSLWSFHVYTSPSRSTFYFWEGTYLDFWGTRSIRARELGALLQAARTA